MMKTFTPTDYIAYLYGETSVRKNYLIEEHLSDHWLELQEFRSLEKAKRELDEILIQPSEHICNQILSFAAA